MRNSIATEKSFSSAFKIKLEKDEIVRAWVKDHAVVDLNSAKKITETLLKITPDASRPVMINLGKINYITKEARDYFKDEKRKPSAPSIALIAKTTLSTFIGNFYLGLNRPKIPTRLFTDETSAIKWLKKFL